MRELKDALRRIESRARSAHHPRISSGIETHVKSSRVYDLAALVKEACAFDEKYIPIVEEVLRANEKEKCHLREIL